jgi:hypothetical protein
MRSGFLVDAWLFAGAQAEILRTLEIELRPVNRAGVKVLDSEAADGLGLMGEGVLSVLPPLVRRGDDDAGGEEFLAGGGEEGINVLLGDGVLWQVEFALDGAVFASGPLLRHDIDADISHIAFLWELVPHPDIRETLGVERIEFQIGADQTLEAVAKVAVAGCLLAELREDGVNSERSRRHTGNAGGAGDGLAGFLAGHEGISPIQAGGGVDGKTLRRRDLAKRRSFLFPKRGRVWYNARLNPPVT